MSYNLICKYESFPRFYEIRRERNDGPYAEMYLHQSPVSNCQSFSVHPINHISSMSDNDVKLLFKNIVREVSKAQFIIDVHANDMESVKKKLQPIIKDIKELPYESTNGSNMILCVVKLNLEKLK